MGLMSVCTESRDPLGSLPNSQDTALQGVDGFAPASQASQQQTQGGALWGFGQADPREPAQQQQKGPRGRKKQQPRHKADEGLWGFDQLTGPGQPPKPPQQGQHRGREQQQEAVQGLWGFDEPGASGPSQPPGGTQTSAAQPISLLSDEDSPEKAPAPGRALPTLCMLGNGSGAWRVPDRDTLPRAVMVV